MLFSIDGQWAILILHFALCHRRSRLKKSMAAIEQQSGTDAHQERAPWEHKTTTSGLMFSKVVRLLVETVIRTSVHFGIYGVIAG